MEDRLSVAAYVRLPESMERMQLVNGFVGRQPAPRYRHQSLVTRLTTLLATHVEAHGLGQVCVSPVDVVLDEPNALVVQPDIVFVAREWAHILRDRTGDRRTSWSELSPRTRDRNRTTTLEWYARYGVRECWIVEPSGWIEVVRLQDAAERSIVHGLAAVRSAVLPSWDVPTARIFA
jgi:Uma2 family endonuclease